MEDNTKSGFVTLIGRPNVGKSTLMNQIMGRKLQLHHRNPRRQETEFRQFILQNADRLFLLTRRE